MPELRIQNILDSNPLGDSDRPAAPGSGLLRGVMGIMCWPSDEVRRMAYLKHEYFDQLKRMDEMPLLKEDPLLVGFLEEFRTMLGGWGALADLPPNSELLDEMKARAVKGAWVGASLCLTYMLQTNHTKQIERGVSLRKVWAFLFRTGDRFFNTPPEKDALKDAWDEYKSVAHLWAAAYYIELWAKEEVFKKGITDLPLPQDKALRKWTLSTAATSLWLRSAIPLARRFQDFGLSYKPTFAKSPLLDKGLIWSLEDVPDWPCPSMDARLSDDLLEIFNDY